MTPEGRLATVVEMLEEIARQGRPADAVAGAFLKARRYIGAKDRRAISDRLWGILRRRARIDWILAQCHYDATPRRRLLADLVLVDRLTPEAVAPLCTGGARGLETLSPQDWALLQQLKGRDLFHHEMPAWVRGEYPEWIEPRLAAVFGDRLAAEMGALRDEASVDLRVNSLKADRETVRARLAAEGLEAEPTPFSPLGLRLPARVALTAQSVFREGMVEVQDEGSQLLAMLTDAQPGQSVVDFCAGAGGKTLALAAAMRNKGRLIACDVNERRAEQATLRLRRAGVHNVTRRILESESDKWVKRHAGTFDRVLVDAPCSGTGTWRRNPDAKWRLSPDNIEHLVALQGRILASAARLVRPGGRLVYATCSLLVEENERQIEAFLAANEGFRPVPVGEQWAATVGGDCPVEGPWLRLLPAQHHTDGFFAAILERPFDGGVSESGSSALEQADHLEE
ncbi:RsmB/NOP family class I SAM-dependent RNA methyltransferase [Telmatospirillum sp.]|uniref:RsmB/NOP family class I SAM-dependent RNA methyltransferase n=1 Tax=Telmatospirillum sp. TaxID=2079197 RepID=UPI00283FE418|nr:RsmB/NOP family class I SAM-dependent RNA methyltransferase [Telmatospirillum sp.]MDR3437688.1 RsmB/NOP family class I SAM-dependent RNA methyltransferase [Telmatospirillum sp.]